MYHYLIVEPDYECPMCHEGFYTSERLDEHLRVHFPLLAQPKIVETNEYPIESYVNPIYRSKLYYLNTFKPLTPSDVYDEPVVQKKYFSYEQIPQSIVENQRYKLNDSITSGSLSGAESETSYSTVSQMYSSANSSDHEEIRSDEIVAEISPPSAKTTDGSIRESKMGEIFEAVCNSPLKTVEVAPVWKKRKIRFKLENDENRVKMSLILKIEELFEELIELNFEELIGINNFVAYKKQLLRLQPLEKAFSFISEYNTVVSLENRPNFIYPSYLTSWANSRGYRVSRNLLQVGHKPGKTSLANGVKSECQTSMKPASDGVANIGNRKYSVCNETPDNDVIVASSTPQNGKVHFELDKNKKQVRTDNKVSENDLSNTTGLKYDFVNNKLLVKCLNYKVIKSGQLYKSLKYFIPS